MAESAVHKFIAQMITSGQEIDPDLIKYLNHLNNGAARDAAIEKYLKTGAIPGKGGVPSGPNEKGANAEDWVSDVLKKKPVEAQASPIATTTSPAQSSKYAGTKAYKAGVKAGQAKAAVKQAVSKVTSTVPQYIKNGLTSLNKIRPAGLGGALAGAGIFLSPIEDAQQRYERGGYEGTSPMIPISPTQVYDEETGQTFDIPNANHPDEIYNRAEDSEASSGYHPEPAPMVPLEDTNQASPVIQDPVYLNSNPLSNLNGLSAADLATAVIRGKYGNGDARRKALGDRYAEVQALVNQRMANSTPKRARTRVTPVVASEDRYAKLPSAVNAPITPTAYSDEELVVPKQLGMNPWQIM